MSSNRPVSVEVYTATHRILGRVMPGSGGLYSYLNIPTKSSIEVDGAHLTHLQQPGRLVARYPRIWLSKDRIVAVLLSSRSEVGPVSIARGGYSTLLTHHVHILVEGFELKGAVETPGKVDFAAILAEKETGFSPLLSAHLEAVLFSDIKAEAPALLFNHTLVSAMTLLPKEEVEGA
jgi:hypothetical protein